MKIVPYIFAITASMIMVVQTAKKDDPTSPTNKAKKSRQKCKYDSDCLKKGYVCTRAYCHRRYCKIDDDCSQGLYCKIDRNECWLIPKETCEEDSDCYSYEYCNDSRKKCSDRRSTGSCDRDEQCRGVCKDNGKCGFEFD